MYSMLGKLEVSLLVFIALEANEERKWSDYEGSKNILMYANWNQVWSPRICTCVQLSWCKSNVLKRWNQFAGKDVISLSLFIRFSYPEGQPSFLFKCVPLQGVLSYQQKRPLSFYWLNYLFPNRSNGLIWKWITKLGTFYNVSLLWVIRNLSFISHQEIKFLWTFCFSPFKCSFKHQQTCIASKSYYKNYVEVNELLHTPTTNYSKWREDQMSSALSLGRNEHRKSRFWSCAEAYSVT